MQKENQRSEKILLVESQQCLLEFKNWGVSGQKVSNFEHNSSGGFWTGSGTIELNYILLSNDLQPREKINQKVVDDYALDLKGGAEFKAVDIFYNGKNFFLVDGFHRFLASKKVLKKSILANIFMGTKRDAILYSVGTNATHGLRRSNADKRRVVSKLLSDKQWRKFSDGEIARKCRVSQPFVGQMRKKFTQNDSESHIRRGADGRNINTSKIGKRTAKKVSVVPCPITIEGTEDEPTAGDKIIQGIIGESIHVTAKKPDLDFHSRDILPNVNGEEEKLRSQIMDLTAELHAERLVVINLRRELDDLSSGIEPNIYEIC